MILWLQTEWHKLVILFVGFCHLRTLIKEFKEDVEPIKQFIERRYHERRNMINPVAILNDISLAQKYIETIKGAVPLIAKIVADGKLAVADKNDPVKLQADIAEVLSDLEEAANGLSALFPPAPVPTVPKAA